MYLSSPTFRSTEIREKVLKYIMIRRTRAEVEKYFGEDLKKQGVSFPEVADPEPIYYQLNEQEEKVFNKTVKLITQDFKYARYKPLTYYTGKLTQPERLAQENMGKFMKILLIKRLESSFYAFKKSINRFIRSYDLFIKEFHKGNVYSSKKYINKIFEYIENGNDEAIQKLIEEDKAERYDAKHFSKEFLQHLKDDLELLKEVQKMWASIERDPKLEKFIEVLRNQGRLKNKENKLIVFTESVETAEYLKKSLTENLSERVLLFTGSSSASIREKVVDNFDAKAKIKKDDYRILLATEALSEGVNLHRSQIVINYDIPWNPTRLMQRVGRINRVDTEFDEIFTYNFFPTTQSNEEIKLKEAAEAKIHSFIEMLGTDAKLLTEGEEIKSHDIFSKLTSKKTITGEDDAEDSELKYLKEIRNVRDENPDLFARIKRLPKKARTAKQFTEENDALLTYFRKGRLDKFYISNSQGNEELDFVAAANYLECCNDEKRLKIGDSFYHLLEKNKSAFIEVTKDEPDKVKMKGGRDSATIILRILKSRQVREFPEYTEGDEEYIKNVVQLIEEGGLPQHTLKNLVKALSKEIDPHHILVKLKKNVPQEFFAETFAESAAQTAGPREVILSEYLVGNHG